MMPSGKPSGDLGSASKTRFTPRPPNQGGREQRPPINQGGRDPRGFDRGRGRMDEPTRRELRRKQLCFTYKEPWDPTHKCMGKGKVHYIELISDDEGDEDFGHIQNMEVETPGQTEEEDASHGHAANEKVTIASISGVPKFNTFRMRGVLQWQKVSVLIDGGASHNFIDSELLQRRHIPTMGFEGFRLEVAGGRTMPCDRYILGMKLTLGRHDLAQNFYVMDLPDTNIILGVQWLSTLGPITTNYKTMEMSFTEETGKKVVLGGMTGNTPRVVTTSTWRPSSEEKTLLMQQNAESQSEWTKRGKHTMHQRSRRSWIGTARSLSLYHQEHHQIGGLSTS
jgi:hypothetical protein